MKRAFQIRYDIGIGRATVCMTAAMGMLVALWLALVVLSALL